MHSIGRKRTVVSIDWSRQFAGVNDNGRQSVILALGLFSCCFAGNVKELLDRVHFLGRFVSHTRAQARSRMDWVTREKMGRCSPGQLLSLWSVFSFTLARVFSLFRGRQSRDRNSVPWKWCAPDVFTIVHHRSFSLVSRLARGDFHPHWPGRRPDGQLLLGALLSGARHSARRHPIRESWVQPTR